MSREEQGLAVHDGATLRLLEALDFPTEISAVSFERSSGRLVVITSEQTVHCFDLAAAGAH